ncbi:MULTISPECIES: M56 family metallopeptidase [unclassified Clostridioides]|uniref:M56 family metallopeptidase n=1 Tax=unclassified Clostridioides TaxID=2635829 RepID=UPI001D12F00B|nr:penicillin-binding protein [Clostridioides sp. ES-S-0049-03]MCC0675829.1 penicillin-binding protein [Clostridioides sp. ES-W-0018-02]MCC0711091.1 penicillin-binding protein [Clostridioides sp. ES-W-0017-02]
MFTKLLEMSVTSGVLILIVIFIRACLFKKLPKKVFVLLWLVVLFKLLVPVSLNSTFSIYSIIESNFDAQLGNASAVDYSIKKNNNSISKNNFGDSKALFNLENFTALEVSSILTLGISITFIMFLCFKYTRTINLFKTSIHIKNHEFIKKWAYDNRGFRKFFVCISEFTKTPLTTGILKPNIILPKQMDYSNNQTLNFVLTHELVHINRFDNILKLFMIVALAVHWFNPLVWVMLFLLNKDIEFSCDEKVMSIVGEEYRADYATALISLAEEHNTFPMTLYNGFGKTKIEERIVNVMKFKKSTYITFLVSAVLICGTSVVFATGNKEIDEVESFNLMEIEQSNKNDFSIGGQPLKIESKINNTNISVGLSAKSDESIDLSTSETYKMQKITSKVDVEEVYSNMSKYSVVPTDNISKKISVTKSMKILTNNKLQYKDSESN